MSRAEAIEHAAARLLDRARPAVALGELYDAGQIAGSKVAHITEAESELIELCCAFEDDALVYVFGSTAVVEAIRKVQKLRAAAAAEADDEARADNEYSYGSPGCLRHPNGSARW